MLLREHFTVLTFQESQSPLPDRQAGQSWPPFARRAEAIQRRVEAFTLVELLVAIGVLVLMVLMFTSIYNHASRAWMNGESNEERRRNVRALGDFIGAELQEALLPVQMIDTASHGNLQFIVDPPQLPSATYGNADSIFWQAPLATGTTYGDIAEVGYFVEWQQNIPMLCRFFVNPSVSSGNVVISNSNFLIYNSNPNAWLTSSLVDQVVQPTNKAQGYVGLFAENVIGLWIRCYALDGTELPRNFDSRQGYNYTVQTTPNVWQEKRYLPATVRVSLAQVDWRSAKQLGAVSADVRTVVKASLDAADFVTQFGNKAKGSPSLARLLPGLRIYSTEVFLRNSR